MLATTALLLALAPQLDLTWEHTYLESVFRMNLSGGAGAAFALVPSLTSGPTSLPLLGPQTLDVGLDLPSFWMFGLLDGAGLASRDILIPVNPNLVGLPLRAQAFTFPGSLGLIDDLSSAVEAQVGNLGQSHLLSQGPLAKRRFHSATELPDGRVLIVGGRGLGPWPLTLEHYDPQAGRFTLSAAQLPQARAYHTATALNNGKVLIVGGVREDGQALASALLYDPQNDTLSNPIPMGSARVGHTADLLPDGRVAVIGGSTAYTLTHPLGWPAVGQNLASAAISLFDPTTNSFSPGPALPRPRLWHASSLLGNGTLLMTGGVELLPGGLAGTSDCRRFDPTNDTWIAAMALPAPRALHGLVGTDDGGVLAISGAEFNRTNNQLIGKPNVYRFSGGNWTQAPNTNGLIINGEEVCLPRSPIPKIPSTPGGTLGDLTDTGPVVVYFAGGGFSSVDLGSGAATLQTNYFSIDPALSSWKPAATVLAPREGQTFTPLDSTIRVLRVGQVGSPSDPGGETTVLNWWLP
jgi:Galactose oxidase, central domain